MLREKYIKRIADLLAWIESKVRNLNCLNYYDINITSETFFADLLNLVFDFELINRNEQKSNSPYADLYDPKRDIYVQVTSTKTTKKIQDTIDGIETFDGIMPTTRVIILLLTDKPVFRTEFRTCSISFNKSTDIYDIKMLLKHISTLATDNLRDIVEYLEKNLDAVNGSEKSICS
jgi:hypothetical protein